MLGNIVCFVFYKEHLNGKVTPKTIMLCDKSSVSMNEESLFSSSFVFISIYVPPVCLVVLVGIVSRPVLVDSVCRAFSRANTPMFFLRAAEWQPGAVAMLVHYRLALLMVL